MKKVLLTILSLTLLTLISASCSSITGGAAEHNDTELYKTAIERYFKATLEYDIDNLLDSIDPLSPFYPNNETIEQLRNEVGESPIPGDIVVKKLVVLEESNDMAVVKVTLYTHIDPDGNGEYFESTTYPTFELAYKDGLWRIFNASLEAAE